MSDKIRVIFKTERRLVPGGPTVIDHEVLEIEAPGVAYRVRGGGYNEDGTFDITQIVGIEVPRCS